MRSMVVPSRHNRLGGVSKERPGVDKDSEWARYTRYINSVLNSIRNGNDDYVYHIYQIADLLRFEHDRLRTEYVKEDGYFRVWLS